MKFLLLLLVLLTNFALGADYTVTFVGNVTPVQKQKINDALIEAHQKLRSPEFKDKIINFTMPDGTKKFYQTELTNEQVYEKLLSSKWDHRIAVYSNGASSARAYVKGGPTVYLNWAYLKDDHKSAIGNTLMHEETHKFKFTHDYERTELRPYTVPYGAGSIIEILMGGNQKIKPLYIPWYKKVWNWVR